MTQLFARLWRTLESTPQAGIDQLHVSSRVRTRCCIGGNAGGPVSAVSAGDQRVLLTVHGQVLLRAAASSLVRSISRAKAIGSM